MHLHRSHDVEQLALALGDLVEANPLPWNQQELVAVQGRGMERWLLMKLAERFGGVLGLEHVFPRALVDRILVATVGEEASELGRWGDAALTWAVLAVLPELLKADELEPIRRYLGAEAESSAISARRLSLARELGTLVDRYATYRPEMARAFMSGSRDGADDAWQPMLVEAVAKRVATECHASVVEKAIARLLSDAPIAGLPARVSLFGVTTLPPMYLRLLDALSHRIEVHFFWLVPTPHYFGDARTLREEARARLREDARKRMTGESVEDVAVGHPLLASLGRSARDFQWVVYGVCDHLDERDELDRFEPAPDASTVLGRLKHDLYSLEPTGTSDKKPSVPFPEGDRSFVIHSCHGKMRQVEALRDELLRAFVEIPDLEPRDVAVLCPDVDTYAPLVRAVFGEGDEAVVLAANRPGFPRIPVRVADTSPRHEASGIDGFLAIVALASGRFGAPDVADVLLRPSVARRFGLESVDPATLIRVLRDTGMRWGIDGAHRTSFGQPEDDAFTLRRGLARLLLGQAMRGGDARAYRDVLPYDDAPDRAVIEGVVEALETIFAFAEDLRKPRRPSELRAFVQRWFAALVELAGDDFGQTRMVEDAIASEVAHAAKLAFDDALDADAQRGLIEHALASPSGPSRLVGGDVSVAGLVPMRAIPFRVVALLGLDEAGFPRRTTGRGFDMTERAPRPGDRRLEDDDRAAMLEAILSASERLVLTYQGRDPHSNERLPMAAPVAELVDSVVAAYVPSQAVSGSEGEKAKKAILERILVEHSLHAFGPSEVAASDPRTFDARLVAQAEALSRASAEAMPTWVDAPLPLRGQDEQGRLLVRIPDLLRFFDDPISAFLEKRARIDLDPSHEELDDREPYELGVFEEAILVHDVLRMSREGVPTDRQHDRLRIAGRLPVGRAGELVYAEARRKVDALLRVAAGVTGTHKLPPVGIDVTLPGIEVGGEKMAVRLVGSIDDRFEAARLRLRPGKLKLKHRLRVFVEQALAEVGGGLSEPTHLYALGDKDDVVGRRYEPVPDAGGYVADVVSVYLEGSRLPLPFTLDAAEAFLEGERIERKKGREAADVERRALDRARASLGDESWESSASNRLDLRRLFGAPPARRLFEDDFGPATGLCFRGVVDRIVRPMFRAEGETILPLGEEGA